ncbi:hypothetical protein [uncultured Aquimarina sp.]|uniref:hypothetical protein n=1 Tax=uncultured Aquimarina sp. TaxID=575652 RepID=UPI00260FD766|nr:hypothetical protein [uncultured Aquimarina sp.]
MKELNLNELVQINGGSEETYNAGHAVGEAIHDAIVDAADAVVGFFDGLFGN